ncbi:RDD family protein [Candidatus Hydrogenedentota bacterium]
MFEVSCQCGKSFKVKEEHAGRKGKCPNCGRLIRLEGPNAEDKTTQAEPGVIIVTCQCGQKLKARDEHIGQTGKCQKCGNAITIEKPVEGPAQTEVGVPADEKPVIDLGEDVPGGARGDVDLSGFAGLTEPESEPAAAAEKEPLAENKPEPAHAATKQETPVPAPTLPNEEKAPLYAGFWLRGVASQVVDTLILLVFAILLSLLSGKVVGGVAGTVIGSVASLLLWLLYNPLFESSGMQATPGKMALSLIVTDMNGRRISFLRAFGRNLAKIVSVIPFSLGFLIAAFTPKRQALHDMIAGTVVVVKPKSAIATYGGFWRRLVAMWIDGLIVGAAIYVLSLIGVPTVTFIATAIVWWLYYALFEKSAWQATPGKRALGLTVTNMEGEKISFGRASGRFWGKFLSLMIFFIGFIGFLMAAFTKRKQALHDMLAKTQITVHRPRPGDTWIPLVMVVACLIVQLVVGGVRVANAVAKLGIADQLTEALSSAGISTEFGGGAGPAGKIIQDPAAESIVRQHVQDVNDAMTVGDYDALRKLVAEDCRTGVIGGKQPYWDVYTPDYIQELKGTTFKIENIDLFHVSDDRMIANVATVAKGPHGEGRSTTKNTYRCSDGNWQLITISVVSFGFGTGYVEDSDTPATIPADDILKYIRKYPQTTFVKTKVPFSIDMKLSFENTVGASTCVEGVTKDALTKAVAFYRNEMERLWKNVNESTGYASGSDFTMLECEKDIGGKNIKLLACFVAEGSGTRISLAMVEVRGSPESTTGSAGISSRVTSTGSSGTSAISKPDVTAPDKQTPEEPLQTGPFKNSKPGSVPHGSEWDSVPTCPGLDLKKIKPTARPAGLMYPLTGAPERSLKQAHGTLENKYEDVLEFFKAGLRTSGWTFTNVTEKPSVSPGYRGYMGGYKKDKQGLNLVVTGNDSRSSVFVVIGDAQ